MINRYYATDCKVKPSRKDGKDIKVIREVDFNKAIEKLINRINEEIIEDDRMDTLIDEVFRIQDCFGEEGK